MMLESPAPAVGLSPRAAAGVKVPFYYFSVFGYSLVLPQGCKVRTKSHLRYTCVSAPCEWLAIDAALGLACAVDNVWWDNR